MPMSALDRMTANRDELLAIMRTYRIGQRTVFGKRWTAARVCATRRRHSVAMYREAEGQARGEFTVSEPSAANAKPAERYAQRAAAGLLVMMLGSLDRLP